MIVAQLVKGDQALFEATIKKLSDGSVVNLTGHTITFRYSINGGRVTTGAATVTDAAAGICTYQIPSPGIPRGGLLEYEWLVNDGSTLVMARDVDGKPFRVTVDKQVG